MKKITAVLLLAGIVFPATGIANIAKAQTKIEPIIEPYPYSFVRVVSPNGGEFWEKEKPHTIEWTIVRPLGSYFPVWPETVSIDLYKREIPVPSPMVDEDFERELSPEEEGLPSEKEVVGESVFVKHIAFVDAWKGSYIWKIGEDIPDGKNYVIRVSAILALPEGEKENEESYPFFWWDESDGPFTIAHRASPPPNLRKAIAALEKIRLSLQKTIDNLVEVIDLLKTMITAMPLSEC